MPTSVARVVALGGVLLLGVAFYLHTDTPTQKEVGPNVVVIMIDTLRADRMGAYGYRKPTTPFLDSLARKGVVFENAFAPAYLTFQSDASILSGLYPSEHNMRTWSTPLADGVTLLPDVYKLYGYDTAAFVSPSLWEYFGLDESFDEYHLTQTKDNLAARVPEVGAWMADRDKPFFLFWHVYDLHVPFRAAMPPFSSGSYSGPFAQGTYINWADQSTTTVTYRSMAEGVLTHTVTPQDVAYVSAAYDTSVRYVDDQLKLFFEKVEAEGLMDNTFFVISSEHGEDLKDHGYLFHRDIYNDTVHVPLIIFGPGIAPRRVATPVSLIDVAPTLTSLSALAVFEDGEGVDLSPLMSGSRAHVQDIYIERAPFEDYAVVSWPWKYIVRSPPGTIAGLSDADANIFFRTLRTHDPVRGDELYNLEFDPGERLNLVGVGLPVEAELKTKAEVFGARMRAARQQHEQPRDVDREKLLQTYP